MGHRYYLWALPKENDISFIIDEIAYAIEEARTSLIKSKSSFIFRNIRKEEKGNILRFEIAIRESVKLRQYDPESDKFQYKEHEDWETIECYWDTKNHFIEIRGGAEKVERIANEINSVFRHHFILKPMIISQKAFNYLMQKRVGNISEKAIRSEGGYIKLHGIYIRVTEFEDFKNLLSKEKNSRRTIRGYYSLPGTLIQGEILPVPLIIDQNGKIQFIKFSLSKNNKDEKGYEEITRQVILDIIKVIKKFEKTQ